MKICKTVLTHWAHESKISVVDILGTEKERRDTLKTNTEALDKMIEASGLRIGYLAAKCGLSRAGFHKKRTGQTEWTANEISILRHELNMTLTQAKDIFLL